MNKLKKSIELLGLNFKSQVIIFASYNLLVICLGVVSFLYLKNVVTLAFTIFILAILDYLFLSRYKTLKIQNNKALLNEFVSLLPFFKTYLDNGYSIYQSFKELKAFVNGDLLKRLDRLTNNIDKDKSVAPYISFAKEFNSLLIEQLMIAIYQMVDEGSQSNYIVQFEMLFAKVRDSSLKDELVSKEKGLSNISMFPLIGSALEIVMITFGILAVVGESINGI